MTRRKQQEIMQCHALRQYRSPFFYSFQRRYLTKIAPTSCKRTFPLNSRIELRARNGLRPKVPSPSVPFVFLVGAREPTATLVGQTDKRDGTPKLTLLSACVIRVTDLAHEALVARTEVTKRDIFYKDVTLFRKQAVVDRIVDDLAATFELQRSDLNIRASSKGLFAGASLSINLRQGGVVKGIDNAGSLIPPGSDISYLVVNEDIGWVLVIEKEAVFQTLCASNFPNNTSLLAPGVIITGKGYPDLATRELLNKLSYELPESIPILALVDADPYGIDIMSVYKYGSSSMKHEEEALIAPRVQWIGVWSSELASLGIDPNCLIPLTAHDHKKALSMLVRPEGNMPKAWRKELMHMLHNRAKAEIEIVCSASPSALQDPYREDDQIVDDTLNFHHDYIVPGESVDGKGPDLLIKYLAKKVNQCIDQSRQGEDMAFFGDDGSSSPLI